MRIVLLALISFSLTVGRAQTNPYNQYFKVSLGMSGEQIDHFQIKNAINDTGAVKMEFLSFSPTIAYSHQFIFGKVLSVGGTAGFQYMNLYYGPDHYGAPYCWVAAEPQVSIVYRKKFEYYIKMQVGATFYFHNPSIIPEPIFRLLPDKANIFTGVTVGGFNFFLNDKLGLNLELSLWAPEMATFGLTYRFFTGEIPEVENDNPNNIENPIENKE